MTPPLRRVFKADGTEEQTNSKLITDLQKPLSLPFQDGIQIEKDVPIGGTTYDVEHGLNRIARGYIVLDLTGNIGYPVRVGSTTLALTFSKPGLASGTIKLWIF